MEQFPEFVPERPPKQYAWPGERAYRQVEGSITAWLSLVMSPKGYNEFTVECGWSRLGRYPQLTARPNLTEFSETELIANDEAFLRLRPESAVDKDWWSVAGGGASYESAVRMCASLTPEESLSLAEPLVADALSCIATVGRPLIRRILKYRSSG